MKGPTRQSARTDSLVINSNVNSRRAIGYIRVSTDMQASEGLSLDAQQSAIEQYCSLHGLRLVKICKDLLSGGKDQRTGLHDALASLDRGADVLVVLKFDRLCSPSKDTSLVRCAELETTATSNDSFSSWMEPAPG